MSQRSPNYRLVKMHRAYTIEEVAQLLNCHRNTVRNWVKSGLETIDGSRPTLIDGATLRAFLKARRDERKRPLKLGEFFCLPCRSAQIPAERIAEYVPRSEAHGNLRAICPSCFRLMYRAVSRDRLEAIRGNMKITFTDEAARIRETSAPSQKCDFRRQGQK